MNEKNLIVLCEVLNNINSSLSRMDSTLSILRSDIKLLTESMIFSESRSFESYVMDRLTNITPGKPESTYTREEILNKLFPYLFSAEVLQYDADHPVTIDPCPKSNIEGG